MTEYAGRSVPRGLRRIVSGLDEMASSPHHHDPAAAMRLEVLRRRAMARVDAAATELALAADARDAPPELRALARSVRAGNATWEQCLLGKADDLPEVRAWFAPAAVGERPPPSEEDDHYPDSFPFRRDF